MALKSSELVAEVNHLSHSYDGNNWVLKDVSFNVKKGEVFGLLGRNGAGKSTLIKILTTLISASKGDISILGLDPVRDGPRIRRRIGVVQQGESFDFTSVEGNFDIYGMLWDVPKKERIERRERLMKFFDLEEVRKKRAWDLSGGQKRKVQVARELMHDSDILFLDEPTVGLDIVMRRSVLDFIRAQVRKGMTVVFTTHNLEEADYLCDRVAVIETGKILAMDTVENLKQFYGKKRTVEVTVGKEESAEFFKKLMDGLPAGDIFKPGDQGSALIITESPRQVLQRIIEVSKDGGVQVDWLNVRKNTLEDVFLDTLAEVKK
jgi:ABC-2 type transport system ATP-binding protein